MNKSLQDKLKLYSTLTSVTIAGASSVQAAIIHTDVNYTGGYGTYDVDINGDLVTDFSIVAFTYDIASGGFSIDISQVGITNNGYSNNQVVGYIQSSSGQTFGVVDALDQGVFIYSTQNDFVSSGALAGTFLAAGTFSGFPFSFPGSLGQFGDVSEKFVGVHFDISGERHYGWLRFKDVAQDGSSWTLVDMAYSDVVNNGIVTGNTVGLKKTEEYKLSVTAGNQQLNIAVDESFSKPTLEVIDITGKVVLVKAISSSNNQIPYNLPEGIYVVRLFNKEKVISKKVKL